MVRNYIQAMCEHVGRRWGHEPPYPKIPPVESQPCLPEYRMLFTQLLPSSNSLVSCNQDL